MSGIQDKIDQYIPINIRYTKSTSANSLPGADFHIVLMNADRSRLGTLAIIPMMGPYPLDQDRFRVIIETQDPIMIRMAARGVTVEI